MSLNGFTNLGESTFTNHVRENLISFFDYGLLEKSNFKTVTVPSTGVYGGIDSRLRPVTDPNYTDGQVWEGFRSNWVWESGVNAATSTDVAYPGVSGVYVSGTFYSVSNTGLPFHINHKLGRVVFDSPMSTSATVECNYSYKLVNVMQVDGMPWFMEIQQHSERSDNENFVYNSGEWGFLAQNRYQLPAIGIEDGGRVSLRGIGLAGGQWITKDYLFHCAAEDIYVRDFLMDMVILQNQKEFNTYNLNSIPFPIDYRGVPVSGALTYPNLVSQFPGQNIRISNVKVDSIYSLKNVQIGTVRVTTECPQFGV